MPYPYRMTSIVLYISEYHRQHCTLQVFEQFGELYMHNLDDKRPTWSGFEPSTSEFRATAGANKPSRPVTYFSLPGTRSTENMGTIYLLV